VGVIVTELTLEALGDVPVARRRTELVERKGLGHPDSVCDALVEAASLALNRLYLERRGTILHYNLDEALLAVGEQRNRAVAAAPPPKWSRGIEEVWRTVSGMFASASGFPRGMKLLARCLDGLQ